ncbi:MAG: TIGR03663 family protein [Verrucomicrobiota bacterium]|nr:TIGR03663 family protein [Verrucomicrobiota bacterium]MDP7048362.1 TIGR03663 family protein [Verrucomicrobiota bacterium]
MSRSIFIALVLIIAAAVTAFRLSQLSERPMHGDEAVNAFKLGETIEGRGYIYDPHEYHGPTLNYVSMIPAWVGGVGSHAGLNEFLLRVVPVFFGTLLVLLLLPVGDGLGRMAAVFAALFMGMSPAMSFYSRYYIHEMLLVVFTAGVIICVYRYLKKPSASWALLAGGCLGLMHATKETFVIALGAMAGALLVLLYIRRRAGQQLWNLNWVRPSHGVVLLLAAAAVSVTLFSSFFSNAKGVTDSILTYATYLDRAGQANVHEYPWHYYLGLLSYYQFADGPVFSELMILFLALIGLGFMVRGAVPEGSAMLLRFVALYTVFMTLIYSLIPYKTPWCLLSFYHGIILLAGVGAACLFQLKPVLLRCAVGGMLFVGSWHLAYQSVIANNRYSADSRNPHVYGHTGSDVFDIAARVKEMVQAHEARLATPIQVYCPGDDYWPLPWYLRDLAVEYGSEVRDESKSAPVILIQPPLEEALMRKLFELPPPGQKELYMHLFDQHGRETKMELRPGVEIRGFVAKSLWDRYERSAEAKAEGQPD